MLMSSSKLFLFSKEVHFNLGVRLLLELYCAVVLKHVAFFTILAKLTVVFTCTSLPLNLYTSVLGCVCGFGLEQKFWRIDGFGEKKTRIGGFAYPYSPPSFSLGQKCPRINYYGYDYDECDARQLWLTKHSLWTTALFCMEDGCPGYPDLDQLAPELTVEMKRGGGQKDCSILDGTCLPSEEHWACIIISGLDIATNTVAFAT